MKEFELLPSEEQIRDMARAFQDVKLRQEIIGGCLSGGKHVRNNREIIDRNTTPANQNGAIDSSSQDSNIVHEPARGKNPREIIEANNIGNFSQAQVASPDNHSNNCHNEPSSQNCGCSHVSHPEARSTCQNCNSTHAELMPPCACQDGCCGNPTQNDGMSSCACQECKPLPCQHNKAAILCMAKTYYLQRDIEQALRRLHSIAPPSYRDNIADIIKLKCQNTEYLLNIYTQLSNELLPYAPNLYNGRNFCQTLAEICALQEKILAKLIDLEVCPQTHWLTSREIVVATALNRMSIFCFFNR